MDVFAALADPVRRDIITRVAAAPATVNDLVAPHAISRPAISRHLRVLREAGVVTVTKTGRRRLHRLDPGALQPVRRLLSEVDTTVDNAAEWCQRAAPAAPISERRIDALDVEVRRTVREHRATGTEPTEEEAG